jgi:hypothetical protein
MQSALRKSAMKRQAQQFAPNFAWALALVIVCPRSIRETHAIIDVRNRVLTEQARDSGHSTPAIAKTPTLRHQAEAGAAPDDGAGAAGAHGSRDFRRRATSLARRGRL